MTDLPPGWKVQRLSEIADVRLGRQRSPKNHSGKQMRPYLRAANVGWSGLLLDDVKEMNFTDGEMDTYRLAPGDLLLSEASGSPGEVGKPALWSGELDCCAFQNTLLRVRPYADEPRYLLHYFRFQALAGRFKEHSRGVGIHHLGRARLARWMTPIPPLDEQRQIVEILEYHLSRIEAAASYLTAVKKRVLTYRRSALNKLFSIDDRTVPLSDVVSGVEAGRSFGAASAAAGPHDWGIIKVSSMTWGEFQPGQNKAVPAERADARFEIKPGDLLISRANTSEYVGASVLVGDVRPRLLLSDKSLRIRPRPGVEPEWLWRALQSPLVRRQISVLASGTKHSMRNISQTALLQVRVPDVPAAQQKKAVARFREFDLVANRISDRSGLAKLRCAALRRVLLAAAFSGKLTGSATELDRVEELAQ